MMSRGLFQHQKFCGSVSKKNKNCHMLTAAFAPGQKKDERIVKLGNGLS